MSAPTSLAADEPQRRVKETPVFKEMSALLALALTWVLTAGIVVVILFTPTYLQHIHHIPAALAPTSGNQTSGRQV